MTVNYFVKYLNTLYYTVEYTKKHCSSEHIIGPNKVAGMWSGYCPQNTLQQNCTAENKCKCRQ